LLSVAAKVARSAGFTPEAVATCFGKLWPRLVQGGNLQLVQLGPKELNIELRAAVLPKSGYFRGTYMGNVRAAIKLLAGVRVLYLKAAPYNEKQDCFTVQISYV
jgi:hypothetical protein